MSIDNWTDEVIRFMLEESATRLTDFYPRLSKEDFAGFNTVYTKRWQARRILYRGLPLPISGLSKLIALERRYSALCDDLPYAWLSVLVRALDGALPLESPRRLDMERISKALIDADCEEALKIAQKIGFTTIF